MVMEYRLPTLPYGNATATVVRWLRQPGDQLIPNEPLLVVVNDRIEVLLLAKQVLTLGELLVAEGAKVGVGEPLAQIILPLEPEPRIVSHTGARISLRGSENGSTPHRLTPVALRVADAAQIDIRSVVGSGPSGRVMKRDVLTILAKHSVPGSSAILTPDPKLSNVTIATPEATQTVSLAPPISTDVLHHFSAAHLLHIPQALTTMDVDMSRIVDMQRAQQSSLVRRGRELAGALCIMCAAVEALLEHPMLNSSWSDRGIIVRKRVHLGIAQSRDDGCMLVVRDAQDLNVWGLTRTINALTRSQISTSVDMCEATFTVAICGAQGHWFHAPTIGQHHSGLLSVGTLQQRPIVISSSAGDQVVIRPIVMLALAYDARIIDQNDADAFLRTVRRKLENFRI